MTDEFRDRSAALPSEHPSAEELSAWLDSGARGAPSSGADGGGRPRGGLSAHVASCEECGLLTERLAAVVSALDVASSLDEEASPVGAGEKASAVAAAMHAYDTLAELPAVSAGRRGARMGRSWTLGRTRWSWRAAAASAAVLAALGGASAGIYELASSSAESAAGRAQSAVRSPYDARLTPRANATPAGSVDGSSSVESVQLRPMRSAAAVNHALCARPTGLQAPAGSPTSLQRITSSGTSCIATGPAILTLARADLATISALAVRSGSKSVTATLALRHPITIRSQPVPVVAVIGGVAIGEVTEHGTTSRLEVHGVVLSAFAQVRRELHLPRAGSG